MLDISGERAAFVGGGESSFLFLGRDTLPPGQKLTLFIYLLLQHLGCPNQPSLSQHPHAPSPPVGSLSYKQAQFSLHTHTHIHTHTHPSFPPFPAASLPTPCLPQSQVSEKHNSGFHSETSLPGREARRQGSAGLQPGPPPIPILPADTSSQVFAPPSPRIAFWGFPPTDSFQIHHTQLRERSNLQG